MCPRKETENLDACIMVLCNKCNADKQQTKKQKNTKTYQCDKIPAPCESKTVRAPVLNIITIMANGQQ